MDRMIQLVKVKRKLQPVEVSSEVVISEPLQP
jgi:hypothetical protein